MSTPHPGTPRGGSGLPADSDAGLTAFLKQEIQSIRQDVQAMVVHEVQRVALPTERAEKLVAEMADKALRDLGARPSFLGLRLPAKQAGGKEREPDAPSTWRPVLAGVVGLVLLAASFYGGRAYERSLGASTGTDGGPVATQQRPPDGEEVAPSLETPVWQRDVARYDSLFKARDPALLALAAEVERQGPHPALRDAINAWRNNSSSVNQEERVRVGIVQWLLRVTLGDAIDLDGLTTRSPCTGQTCGGLRRYWEAAPPNRSHPVLGDSATEEAVHAAEKLLIMERLSELRP